MSPSIQTIPLLNLALAFIPVIAVIIIIGKWQLGYKSSLYAVARMLIQLLLIGYFLTYIFKTESVLIIVAVLAVMLFSASSSMVNSPLICGNWSSNRADISSLVIFSDMLFLPVIWP